MNLQAIREGLADVIRGAVESTINVYPYPQTGAEGPTIDITYQPGDSILYGTAFGGEAEQVLLDVRVRFPNASEPAQQQVDRWLSTDASTLVDAINSSATAAGVVDVTATAAQPFQPADDAGATLQAVIHVTVYL